MKPFGIFILVVAVLVFGAFLVKRNPDVVREITNSEMLQDKTATTSISVIPELEYFPDAKGYFARPAREGSYPGVVMIHENRGLRPEIKATAEELAKQGYMVLAVDLFNGQVVEDQTAARALTASFNQATGTANMRAAARYLREQGVTEIASLGWCFGGRQSIELAVSGEELDATVVYYGGGMATTTERLAPIEWPVLGISAIRTRQYPLKRFARSKIHSIRWASRTKSMSTLALDMRSRIRQA